MHHVNFSITVVVVLWFKKRKHHDRPLLLLHLPHAVHVNAHETPEVVLLTLSKVPLARHVIFARTTCKFKFKR
jgi:hypothetical protein